jgi:hypothetical protein
MLNQKMIRETALAWPTAARSRAVLCPALRRGSTWVAYRSNWVAYKGRPAAKPAEPPKAAPAPAKQPSPGAAPRTPEPAMPKPQEPAKKGH